MNNNPQTRIPTGGVNRTNLAHVTNPSDWWSLLNLRPDNGGLLQTPSLGYGAYFTPQLEFEAANVRLLENIVNAGAEKILVGFEQEIFLTGTEPAVSPKLRPIFVWMTQAPAAAVGETVVEIDNAGSVVVEEIDAFSVLYSCTAATTVVAVTPINQQVLLFGTLANRFKLINDTITLEILTSTTAQWKFNDGAWYPFTIASVVAIDPGLNISLAFMATTEFVPGHVWVWTASYFAGVAEATTVQTCRYNSDVYIAGYGRQIVRLRDNAFTAVGYVPVYGKHVAVFYNHLVVSHFAEGIMSNAIITDAYNANTTPWQLAWSHLNDPDQFFPTDLNEADRYSCSSGAGQDALGLGITGLAQYNDVLMVYLVNTIYMMRYVGLPNVMQLDILSTNVGSIFSAGLVVTNSGHFFIGANNIYVYDGIKPTAIGFEVIEQFFDEVQNSTLNPRYTWTYGRYDYVRNEIAWTYWINLGEAGYQCKQLIYQIDSKRYYFRHLPSTSTSDSEIRTWINDPVNRDNLYYGGRQALLRDVVPTTYPDVLNPEAPEVVGFAGYVVPATKYLTKTLSGTVNTAVFTDAACTIPYEVVNGQNAVYTATLTGGTSDAVFTVDVIINYTAATGFVTIALDVSRAGPWTIYVDVTDLSIPAVVASSGFCQHYGSEAAAISSGAPYKGPVSSSDPYYWPTAATLVYNVNTTGRQLQISCNAGNQQVGAYANAALFSPLNFQVTAGVGAITENLTYRGTAVIDVGTNETLYATEASGTVMDAISGLVTTVTYSAVTSIDDALTRLGAGLFGVAVNTQISHALASTVLGVQIGNLARWRKLTANSLLDVLGAENPALLRPLLYKLLPDDVYDTMTRPYAETPDLYYGDLMSVKEHSSFLLDAYYGLGAGVEILHSARMSLSHPVEFNALVQPWTYDLAERTLSFPRTSGVIFRYKFRGINIDFAGSTPDVQNISAWKLYGYADFLYNNKAEK